MTEPLTQRMNLAAESLLDNEALTAQLDEPAASALLDWGLACVKLIVRDTADLDEEAAETFIAPKLRAVRLLMRSVNQWVTTGEDRDDRAGESSLNEILEQAAKIYPNYQPPNKAQQQALLKQPLLEEPSEWILNLRRLVEGSHEEAQP
ncbi:hypothetical protein [Microcoleus sp. FACHB-672]|uniref:hypothetical protein n=1 Tax=Microcoleus sp. FACHB-672 TaxID=2692825 RepID=UPI001686CB75|nr:hypothetical protein [Microcoleus sp. FACHB-672]MBD2040838.1 hypothetical protein [Microcoleus sp. FACHB-672]